MNVPISTLYCLRVILGAHINEALNKVSYVVVFVSESLSSVELIVYRQEVKQERTQNQKPNQHHDQLEQAYR